MKNSPSRCSSIELILFFVIACLIGGCLGIRGITQIKKHPYALLYQDDSSARFGDAEDNVFIEVRTVPITKPLENLAIHYYALFPGGEVIRPGDSEEYLMIDGNNAYKVTFRTNYIRRRKRISDEEKKNLSIPPGWNLAAIEDPITGKPVSVLLGPVIPRQKILYLVEGKKFIYYIFLRADGEFIESAKKKFEEFVRKDIKFV